MKKQKISRHLVISIIISCSLLLKYIVQGISLIASLTSIIPQIGNEASSVGLIGGLEGPTAVFLSSSFGLIIVLPVIESIGIIYVLLVLIGCYRQFKGIC